MDFQNCWNSIFCLEGWERSLRLTSVVAGLIVVVGGMASYYVTKQITLLKAPRTLTTEQIEMIFSTLKDKPKGEFQVTSWADSEESANYGGQLHKALKDVGWNSKGMTRYYMDEGEAPPTGVNIIVDGLSSESMKSAENLVEVFRASGIHDVKFSTKIPKPMVSSWVLIEVGRKPNL
jgi:hypothetical protein